MLIVSNLDDSGEGSFRAAAEASGKRTILFAVSGTIHLQSKLTIKGDATIAGQTAPGDGICLADQPVSLAGDNIILRYMRFRMGDKFQSQKGMVDGSGGDDAFGASRRNHIIIDHCSMSWSTDEVFSIYGGDSTTVQWNIIAEPLNYSYHFETGDKDFEHHGYGGIWGGKHLSAHHNLFAHCVSRNPRFNGARLGASEELVDYRNNVIYNWGGNNVYGGEGGQYNVVGNYYKYGPATNPKVRARVVNPTKNDKQPFGKFYVAGNYIDGAPDVTNDNLLGVAVEGSAEDKRNALAAQPFAVAALPVQTAQQAYEQVLKWAGASYRRDTLDARIMDDLRQRKGRIIDVQGGYPHGTPYEQTTNAWPTLKATSAPADTDRDGMPDGWERSKGLNPSDASDANGYTLDKQYTNIEVYINSLLDA